MLAGAGANGLREPPKYSFQNSGFDFGQETFRRDLLAVRILDPAKTRESTQSCPHTRDN